MELTRNICRKCGEANFSDEDYNFKQFNKLKKLFQNGIVFLV